MRRFLSSLFAKKRQTYTVQSLAQHAQGAPQQVTVATAEEALKLMRERLLERYHVTVINDRTGKRLTPAELSSRS